MRVLVKKNAKTIQSLMSSFDLLRSSLSPGASHFIGFQDNIAPIWKNVSDPGCDLGMAEN